MDEQIDTGLTGLVTSTVTPTPHTCASTIGSTRCDICFAPLEVLQVPAVIPPQVPAAEMPDGWTIHKVAALVRDLAMNLYDEDATLKKYGLSPEQFKTLRENKFFVNALEAATIEWNSPQSTTKRLAMEAAIALEDALPAVAARLSKTNEPLPGVVELVKIFAKMAGVGETNQPQAVGEKFKITINLGADMLQRDATPMITVQEASNEEHGAKGN